MTASIEQHSSNGAGKVILLLAVIAFSAVVYLYASGNLSDLPLTQHAAQGRAGTGMDADEIRRMIDNRECRPIEFYVCPPVNQSKAICHLKVTNTDELWAGVIIGLHPPNKIITGYVAPYFEYWIPANARDGCWLASRIN